MATKNPYQSGGMFEGASHLIFENAKALRKNMTDAEKALWLYLKRGVLGLKIRRQHPLGVYIADFYCHCVKLIIEVDGSIHDSKEMKQKDMQRESDLKKWGYAVIRFSNQEVMNSSASVLVRIENKIAELNNIQKNSLLCKTAESKSPL